MFAAVIDRYIKTLLYGIIDRYYPEFRTYMAEQWRSLPLHVQKEFDEYLKCGRLGMDFYAYNTEPVTMNDWLRSAVSGAVSVPVAAPGAWPKVQAC